MESPQTQKPIQQCQKGIAYFILHILLHILDLLHVLLYILLHICIDHSRHEL